jgi:hypothetical protein
MQSNELQDRPGTLTTLINSAISDVKPRHSLKDVLLSIQVDSLQDDLVGFSYRQSSDILVIIIFVGCSWSPSTVASMPSGRDRRTVGLDSAALQREGNHNGDTGNHRTSGN